MFSFILYFKGDNDYKTAILDKSQASDKWIINSHLNDKYVSPFD